MQLLTTDEALLEEEEKLTFSKIPKFLLSYLAMSPSATETIRNTKTWDMYYPWLWVAHVLMAFLHLWNLDEFSIATSQVAVWFFVIVIALVPLSYSVLSVVVAQNTSFKHLNRVASAGLPWIWAVWIAQMAVELMEAFILIPYTAMAIAITRASRRGSRTALVMSPLVLALYGIEVVLVSTMFGMSDLPGWLL